jgi:hypothetical protein
MRSNCRGVKKGQGLAMKNTKIRRSASLLKFILHCRNRLCYVSRMPVALYSNNISGFIDRRGLDGNRGSPSAI